MNDTMSTVTCGLYNLILSHITMYDTYNNKL